MARSKTRLRFIFGLKLKSKLSRVFCGSRKCGLFFSALQQSFAATSEFVGDEAGEEVDRRHGFGLSLAKPGFEHGGDSAQP